MFFFKKEAITKYPEFTMKKTYPLKFPKEYRVLQAEDYIEICNALFFSLKDF